MKECNICKETKPLDEFVKRSNRASGRQSYCKKCHNIKSRDEYSSDRMKDYDLKKLYGISLDDYEQLFNEQEGSCKICSRHISELNHGHKKNLCVDHNHDTGKIRGLLCDKCNRGLGLFCDDETMLLKAVDYLKNNN